LRKSLFISLNKAIQNYHSMQKYYFIFNE